MQKRKNAFSVGFVILFLVQQVQLLALAGYVFQITGKRGADRFEDMETELDQQILEARKKAFGMKKDGKEK